MFSEMTSRRYAKMAAPVLEKAFLAGVLSLAAACEARTVGLVACEGTAECEAVPACEGLECGDTANDPIGLLIDDFQDGDAYPSEAEYSFWTSYTYCESQLVDFAVAAPSGTDELAIQLDWEIHDPPNGNPDWCIAAWAPRPANRRSTCQLIRGSFSRTCSSLGRRRAGRRCRKSASTFSANGTTLTS